MRRLAEPAVFRGQNQQVAQQRGPVGRFPRLRGGRIVGRSLHDWPCRLAPRVGRFPQPEVDSAGASLLDGPADACQQGGVGAEVTGEFRRQMRTADDGRQPVREPPAPRQPAGQGELVKPPAAALYLRGVVCESGVGQTGGGRGGDGRADAQPAERRQQAARPGLVGVAAAQPNSLVPGEGRQRDGRPVDRPHDGGVPVHAVLARPVEETDGFVKDGGVEHPRQEGRT